MIHSMQLPRSTPEAQGISSPSIQAFVDTLEQRNLGVHSLMLVRNGFIVADGWWKPYAAHLPHSMFSVSQSFTSTAARISNRPIQFEPNALHAGEASFTFDKNTCTFTLRDEKGAQYVVRCGRADWIVGEAPLWFHEEQSTPLRVAMHGRWTDDHTFVMIWQYIETPFRYTITSDFSTDEVDISVQVDVSFRAEHSERLHGRLVSS